MGAVPSQVVAVDMARGASVRARLSVSFLHSQPRKFSYTTRRSVGDVCIPQLWYFYLRAAIDSELRGVRPTRAHKREYGVLWSCAR